MTVAAVSSVSPVMFGPAKSLGAAAAAPDPSRVPGGAPFHHEESAVLLALCGGGGCVESHYASTNPVREEEGLVWSPKLTGNERAWLDWKVREATAEDPARRVELTSIRCRGFLSVFLFAFVLSSSCELDGVASPAQ